MIKFIKKNYRIITIVLLSAFLSFIIFKAIQYGIYAEGLFQYFYISDVACMYVCRHLYAVCIIFSILTLMLISLFNKINEKIKFVSLYVSILHIVIYFVLMIVSSYVSTNALPFFSNVIWLTVAFISLPIFVFTVVFAFKNQEVLEVKEDKENLELF